MIRLAALTCIAAVLAGCQSTPVKVAAAFDERQAAAMLQPGTNRIEGQAFTRKLSGAVVTAAGDNVYLIPATDYARERMATLFPGGVKLNPLSSPRRAEEAPAEYERHMRVTKADTRGHFAFENVRPGVYFLVTRVAWVEMGSPAAARSTTRSRSGATGRRTTSSCRGSEPQPQ